MRPSPSLSSIALITLASAMACATAYDEEQVGDVDALTDASTGNGGESSSGPSSTTNPTSETNVMVGSATTMAASESSTDDSSTSSSTTGSGSPSTVGGTNTSSTSGGGDGGSGGASTTDATTLGTGGTGGDSGMGGAGGASTMGANTTMGMGTTGTGVVGCTDPVTASVGHVELGTTGAACFFIEGAIAGWNCSSMEGRTIAVNGMSVAMCGGALPAQMDGGYYFAFSAGNFEWAAFDVW